ncbi:MAG: ribonuclease III family protein [Bacteroides sp.]|nr:MAG: ribonuclease III family protein [Bacteroides sp.]
MNFLNKNSNYLYKNIILIYKIYQITSYIPYNLYLYRLAFSHSSLMRKNNNERLEFLGDSILNSIISEILYNKYPYMQEGKLTQLRSKIINRKNLNQIAFKLDLIKLFSHNVKLDKNFVLNRSNILGNMLEALIGAIYLDKGFQKTKFFIINKIINKYINWNSIIYVNLNFKGKILEWAQKNGNNVYFKSLFIEQNRVYQVDIIMNNKIIHTCKHYSKKEAEQKVSQKACKILNI